MWGGVVLPSAFMFLQMACGVIYCLRRGWSGAVLQYGFRVPVMVSVVWYLVSTAVFAVKMYATPGGMTQLEQERTCLVVDHDSDSGPRFVGEEYLLDTINWAVALSLGVAFTYTGRRGFL